MTHVTLRNCYHQTHLCYQSQIAWVMLQRCGAGGSLSDKCQVWVWQENASGSCGDISWEPHPLYALKSQQESWFLFALSALRLNAATRFSMWLCLAFSVGVHGFTWIHVIVVWFAEDTNLFHFQIPVLLPHVFLLKAVSHNFTVFMLQHNPPDTW